MDYVKNPKAIEDKKYGNHLRLCKGFRFNR